MSRRRSIVQERSITPVALERLEALEHKPPFFCFELNCGKYFSTEHGLRVHNARVHKTRVV